MILLSLSMFCLKNFLLLFTELLLAFSCIAQQNVINDTLNKTHRKALSVILIDTDKDGVPDQFDKEPNTPPGCPVDTHGVSLDTDGDGVPDCRDKEKLTQQKCFPVDSNGVGSCPEPECCNRGNVDDFSCRIGALPSINYNASAKQLSNQQQLILDSIVIALVNYPDCHLKIQGHYTIQNNKSKQTTEMRIQNIIRYFTIQKEISKERFVIAITEGSDANKMDFIPINRH
jgi:hypothetical protein